MNRKERSTKHAERLDIEISAVAIEWLHSVYGVAAFMYQTKICQRSLSIAVLEINISL